MTRREAAVLRAVIDGVVAPAPPLPPVADTDAVRAFETSLAAAPPANRAGIRAGLLALEVAPLLVGQRRRLTALDAERRGVALTRLERHPALGGVVKALRALAQLHYYGDPAVLRLLGYDADAVVARAAALRAAEHRW